MFSMRLSLTLALSASLLAPMHAAEPQTPLPGRKKVALVLGGGAALGLSHVGVLQWLEEQHIPVDYVAGTSMGGLVGALYATGYDSGEVIRFVRDIDWTEALRLSPAFQQLSYRRKEDLRSYPSQIEVGLAKGVHLPSGLSAGQGVGMVLSRFTAYYDDLPNFGALPIPFRCVATDLISGNEVVFSKGRLFDALRSTMAIPGVFTPWKLDGQVLVDGGTLDNLPVEVARAMGADVVIAVVLETPPIESKAVASLLGVAGRTISVMIANNEKRSLAHADIIIAPRLQGFTSTSYEKSEELRQTGYAAAEAQSQRLKPLALPGAEWREHLEQRRARRRDRAITPAEVRVAGALPGLRVDIPAGAPVDRSQLEHELTAIAGLGRYDSADYRYLQDQGRPVLQIDARQNPYFSRVFNALLELDGASGQGLRFGLGGRVTFLDFGGPASEWRTSFNVGAGDDVFNSEYYWRPGGARFFLAPTGGYSDVRLPIVEDRKTLAEYAVSGWSGGADAGWAISSRAELRAGYRASSVNGRITSGTLPVPSSSGVYHSLETAFQYEGQDSPLVPRQGVRVSLTYNWVASAPRNQHDFGVFEGSVSYARLLRGGFSALLSASGGATAERADLFSLFTLGGTARLSALSFNQLFGHQYFLTQAGIIRSLGHQSLFGRLYTATFYESGATYLTGVRSPVYYNGTAGLLGETLVGVLFVGGSVGDKGERKVFFKMGRVF